MGFEQTNLWTRTLAVQADDPFAREREVLRAELLKSRGYAATIAGEINRDMPDYTVHDITHIDGLWDMADIVSGDDFALSPTEAYIFGMAVLTHDLAMGLSAYPRGLEELTADDRWRDALIVALRRKFGRTPTSDEIRNPDPSVESRVRVDLLRERHAGQAAKVPTADFGVNGSPLYFIADPELRGLYGDLIGRLAASHWWDANRLPPEFSVLLGAPGHMPQEWMVDPLKIACLLRCADATHLDIRRAPIFLKAIRRVEGYSADHWTFQQHLQRPRLEGDRLAFTAAQPFSANESEAWWICLDTARMVDHELKSVDAVLADEHRPRLAARSVARVDDPKRFSKYVPVRDWVPVDAQLHVGDVRDLVRKLGGEELYGRDPHVPLRELMANGSDALAAKSSVMAARGQVLPSGSIKVSFVGEGDSTWLVVEDDGLVLRCPDP